MYKVQKILIFLMMLFVPLFVNAKVMEADSSVKYDKKENTSKFIAGNDIINTSEIDGISFIAGNTVSTSAKSTYGMYAANSITINDEIEKDLFVAANKIVIDKNATLPRDVFIVGNVINIKSDIGRNLYISGSHVDLSGIKIKGNVNIYADEILFNEQTVIKGKLTYNEDAKVDTLKKAKIGKKEVTKSVKVEETFIEKVYSEVESIIAGIITLIVLLGIFSSVRKSIDGVDIKFNNLCFKALIGLIVLIFVPFVSLIALFTGILTPLAIILLIAYGVAIYLSFLLVDYIVGKKLWALTKKKSNFIIEVIIGVLVMKLISLIPYLGGWLSFIVLLLGLGLIESLIQKTIKLK